LSNFDFERSVISKFRKGTPEDPFLDINESFQVINSMVVLSETPDSFTKVVVTGNGVTWIETTDINPTENMYYVDYLYGLVKFNSTRNGLTLNFGYKGKGCEFYSAKRIFASYASNPDGSLEVTETLQEILDKASYNINEFNHKGDWDSSTAYKINNIVDDDNFSYMCIQDNTDHKPTNIVSDIYWKLLSGIQDFNHKGNWLSTTQYYKNNIVLYSVNNSSYICILDVLSATNPASDTTHWKPLVDLTSVNSAEATRIASENNRISSEITRGSNETARVENEATRSSSEVTRIASENARISAETARVNGGALIKSGDIMNGTLTIAENNGILFGSHIKLSYNSELNSLDFEFI